ncbi:MAG: hypothetical protein WBA16_10170 [Nonlabens sp.]
MKNTSHLSLQTSFLKVLCLVLPLGLLTGFESDKKMPPAGFTPLQHLSFLNAPVLSTNVAVEMDYIDEAGQYASLVPSSMLTGMMIDSDGDGVNDDEDIDDDNDGILDIYEGSCEVTNLPNNTPPNTNSTFQTVNTIIADFDGYWQTEVGNNNPVEPDNSFNLIAFEANNQFYPTGVRNTRIVDSDNDGLLDGLDQDNNGSFETSLEESQWSALLPSSLQTSSTLYILEGSDIDGDPGNEIGPMLTPITGPYSPYLFQGPRGLDLGYGLANINVTVSFDLDGLNSSRIGDGIYDILLNQTAVPSGNAKVSVYVLDELGNYLGQGVEIDWDQQPVVGSYEVDQYKVDNTQRSAEQSKEIRFAAIELGAFGLTPSEIVSAEIVQIVYSNTADTSFIAINETSFIATCFDVDTDGDGIPNRLDLDSDNDGIPDNIEGQGTLAYIAPSGNDADNDGLDDAYDATPNGSSSGAGSNGFVPINTDDIQDYNEDTLPDFLDLDSDGDGIFDVTESGRIASGDVTDTNEDGVVDGVNADFGSNGLIDELELNDTDQGYIDANGFYDNTPSDNFTDVDNDVNTGGDLDFRDITVEANDESIAIVGGTAQNDVINVLANDRFQNAPASLTNLTIDQIISSNAGIVLDASDGFIDVQATVPTGTYTVGYRICETGTQNCDTAVATVIVQNELDSDLDGIPNSTDLDDDNDGILDSVEGCASDQSTIPNADEIIIISGLDGNLRRYDVPSQTSTLIRQLGAGHNGMAFNTADGYFWLRNRDNNQLRALDPRNGYNFVSSTIVPATQFPSGVFSATFDPIRKVFVGNNNARVFVVQGDPEAVNYGAIINNFTHNIGAGVNDIAYNNQDGFIYGIRNGSNNLIRIDIGNTTVTNLGAVTNLPSGTYGRAFYESSGLMYFVRNSSAVMYSIDLSQGLTATVVTTLTNLSSTTTELDAATVPGVSFNNTIICRDSDEDGIVDSLDLDSDNDGIPDNVEAQSSTSYVTPSGQDDDNDGLDNAYDLNDASADENESRGLIPQNTDGTDLPDYLDLDSDNDGIFDIEESGRGLANDGEGRVTDSVGNNGLVLTEETADGYADPNGRFTDDPRNDLSDTDGDVNNGGDLDYRDSQTFTISMPTQTVLENNAFTSTAPVISNTPAGNITYSISGADSGLVTINPSTGVVTMIARDFENSADSDGNNFYNLIITATSDQGGSASNEFAIIVNNVCEDVPATSNKLRATDPLGVINSSNTATVQVQLLDSTGFTAANTAVTFTVVSGAGVITTPSALTDANGQVSTTVTSTTAGITVIRASYDSNGDSSVNQAVEMGSPTRVRFVSDLIEIDNKGEVGINNEDPHPSSILEVRAVDRGLLIPQVALTGCSDTATIPNPATSLMVFNTQASSSLDIGFVYFDGEEWKSICQNKRQQ